MRTTTESDDHAESDETSLILNETMQFINKNDQTQPLNITGLALMRTIDFWILFCIMSLREYLCCWIMGC